MPKIAPAFVVQRMQGQGPPDKADRGLEEKQERGPGSRTGYSLSSVSVHPSNVCGEWRHADGDRLVIVDTGERFTAYVNGRDVGYLTYEETSEEGPRRLRCGYILVQPGERDKKRKTGAALLFCFAMLALERGISVVSVGSPDRGLRNYWQEMGFDFAGAQQHDYNNIRSTLLSTGEHPLSDLPPVEETFIGEAFGSPGDMLARTQAVFRQHWNP